MGARMMRTPRIRGICATAILCLVRQWDVAEDGVHRGGYDEFETSSPQKPLGRVLCKMYR